MKKYVSFFIILSAILTMTYITIYAVADKKTVSDSEQRELAKKPEFSIDAWLGGQFQTDVSDYFSDHVYERDRLIGMAQGIENTFKLPGKNLILKDINEEGDGVNNNETENMILENRIVPLYTSNDDALVYFFDSNNAMFQIVPKRVKKYLMICPGRIEYEEDSVKEYSDSARQDVEIVYSNMDESVTTVPVFDAVSEGVSEHGLNEMFFRTDHHWTALAAYYAAQEFLEAAGKEPIDLTKYERKRGYDFQGYLTVKNNKENAIRSDSLFYYEPKSGNICPTEIYWKSEETGEIELRHGRVIDPQRGGYYTFVEKSQFAYAVIDGNKEDGSSLLMVSDSYGLALSTWLVDEYDTIVIVDPRYYEGVDISFPELFEKYRVTDFFLCLQEEEMRVSLFHIKMMENLLGVK